MNTTNIGILIAGIVILLYLTVKMVIRSEAERQLQLQYDLCMTRDPFNAATLKEKSEKCEAAAIYLTIRREHITERVGR